MDSSRRVEILLIEDNPGDVHLTLRALKAINLSSNLTVVQDGLQALDFLYRQGEYKDAPRPHLILLDLNLPKKNGSEVLATIKNDPDLLSIPVVILSSSDAEHDILQAYKLHANSYVTKPGTLKQFMAVAETIHEFWLSVAKLPRE